MTKLHVAPLAGMVLLLAGCSGSSAADGSCAASDSRCASPAPAQTSGASDAAAPDTGDAGIPVVPPDAGDPTSHTPEDAGTLQSTTDAGTPPVEDAGVVDSGKASDAGATGLPLGAKCTQPSDCASDLCEGFEMQTVHYCTKACQTASDCPNPPTAGTCTPNGYCKFN